MKNKNKSAYELFMKRRTNYEVQRAKQEKLKRMGYQSGVKNGFKNGQLENNKLNQKALDGVTIPNLENKNDSEVKRQFESSVQCMGDEGYEAFD